MTIIPAAAATMKSNSVISVSASSSSASNKAAAASAGRKSASLPPETVEYLKAWMMSPEHIAHPYPTEQEKAQIRLDTGIELKQLTNWFVNNRKRFWKPRIEQGKKTQQEQPTTTTRPPPSSTNHLGDRHHCPRTLRQQAAVAVSSSSFRNPSMPFHTSDAQLPTASDDRRGEVSGDGGTRREGGFSVSAPAGAAALPPALPPSPGHNHRRHSHHPLPSTSSYADPHTVSEEGSGSSSACEDYSEEEGEDESTYVSSRSNQSYEGASSSESTTVTSLAGQGEHPATAVIARSGGAGGGGSGTTTRLGGSYCRHEEVDLFVVRPESTNCSEEEPLPTLRDLTIRPSVPRDRILATFKCPISYEIPYEIEHDKRKIQSRRDGEVLRIKKHYLKLYLATRGICSANSPVLGSSSSAQVVLPPPSSSAPSQERVDDNTNTGTTLTVTPPSSSSSSSSSVSSSDSSNTIDCNAASSSSWSSRSEPSLHHHQLRADPTPSPAHSTSYNYPRSSGGERSRKRRRTGGSEDIAISGEEEWRTRCRNAKSFFCETLPGLDEAAWMFGYRSNDDDCLLE